MVLPGVPSDGLGDLAFFEMQIIEPGLLECDGHFDTDGTGADECDGGMCRQIHASNIENDHGLRRAACDANADEMGLCIWN